MLRLHIAGQLWSPADLSEGSSLFEQGVENIEKSYNTGGSFDCFNSGGHNPYRFEPFFE